MSSLSDPSCSHAGCGPEGVLTLAASVTGLLAFSSKVIPLLIYTTTSDQPKEPRRVRRLCNEILQVTAYVEMLQPYLRSSWHQPINLESLLALLAEIVALFSEIEKILSKLQGKSSKLVPKFEGIFMKRKILSMTQRLSWYGWLLDMVLDTLQGFNPPDYDSETESWVTINPEVQICRRNDLIKDKLKCERCLRAWGRCEKCQKGRSSPLPKSQTLPPMVDLSYHSELSLPIRLDELVNSGWYKIGGNASPTAVHSIVEELLQDAAMASRRLPPPGSPSFPWKKASQPSKKAQGKINSDIEKHLQNLNEEAAEQRIVIFGFQDAISNFHKLLKIRENMPQSNRERYAFLPMVFNYLLRALELAVRKVERDGGFDNPEDKAWAILLCLQREITQPCWPRSWLLIFTKLWNNTKVQSALRDADSLHSYDVLQSFFHDINRLFFKSYLPTNEEIRITSPPYKRSVIYDFAFQVNSHKYRLLHLACYAGRRKWISHFGNFDALFVVDISTYDQAPFENHAQTHITENVVLFESVINSRQLMNSKIILLFTNIDRFRKMVREGGREAMKLYPGFQGQGYDVEDWLQFFTDLFMGFARRNGGERQVCTVEYTWEKDRGLLDKVDRGLRMGLMDDD